MLIACGFQWPNAYKVDCNILFILFYVYAPRSPSSLRSVALAKPKFATIVNGRAACCLCFSLFAPCDFELLFQVLAEIAFAKKRVEERKVLAKERRRAEMVGDGTGGGGGTSVLLLVLVCRGYTLCLPVPYGEL